MRFWVVFAWVSSALLLAPAQEAVLTDNALRKPISREGVDWKKVFQEAGLAYEPAEGMLKTSLNTIPQFTLPPRLFEQYVLNQSRSASFDSRESP